MAIPQTCYAKRPEGMVAYQVLGDGPLDLVFIPDFTTNVEIMWEDPGLARFLRRLASFSRLICYDKLGIGVSDRVPNFSKPLEIYLDDVRAVMEAVGSQRVALFAHAEGGLIAMLFAATFPEKVSFLILAEGAARRLRAPDYEWGIPAEAFDRYAEVFDRGYGTVPMRRCWHPAEPGIAPFATGMGAIPAWRWAQPMQPSVGAGP